MSYVQKILQILNVLNCIPKNLDFRQSLIAICACTTFQNFECFIHLQIVKFFLNARNI